MTMYTYVEVPRHEVLKRERDDADWALRRSRAAKALDRPPRIRWFRQTTPQRLAVDRAAGKAVGTVVFEDDENLRGLTKTANPDEIWICVGQTCDEIIEAIEHETLHCVQIKTYGAEAVGETRRGFFEKAARAYGMDTLAAYNRVAARTREFQHLRRWGLRTGVLA